MRERRLSVARLFLSQPFSHYCIPYSTLPHWHTNSVENTVTVTGANLRDDRSTLIGLLGLCSLVYGFTAVIMTKFTNYGKCYGDPWSETHFITWPQRKDCVEIEQYWFYLYLILIICLYINSKYAELICMFSQTTYACSYHSNKSIACFFRFL